jgi:23S rRNA pseudouridine1911/1915/1917 synthase
MSLRRTDTFVVLQGEEERLDRFLVRHLPDCSRRQARLAIGAGGVLVNGRRGRKGYTVRPGDVVRADLSILDGEPTAQPELQVSTLYVDEAVVAVDKPAGMPSIALRADDRDTLANYLLGHYPELRALGGSPFEAGLVHRLDTPTSGVLVAARTVAAWDDLRAQFRARRVQKLYLAVVAGNVTTRGIVATAIAHRPRRPREMAVCVDPAHAQVLRARPALTRYRPLRRFDNATLLAVRIPTGVRHQIRVHLASIGHPIVGDQLYADTASARAADRLLLHAVRLGISHPTTRRRLIIRCPLPGDFQAALHGLMLAPR